MATSPATVTRIGYNNLFPLSTTDPKGQVYQTAYNALGWVTSETDPAGGVTSHAYSVDGDLRQTTTRRGQTVTVTYDALHRPLTQTGSHARSFSYANNGFVVTGTSAASTQTSFLNLRGQADSVQTVLQGQTFVQRFGYTAAGLLDTVSVTGPGGMTFQGRKYLYDEAQGLLTGIRLGGALTQFVTDGNANPTGITFPAGDTQQILRGVIQAPIRLTTSAPYVETVERWLGLDKAGRVTAHLNYPDADLGRFFQFDPLGRLIEGKDMQRPPSGGQTGCPEDPNAILCADGSVPSEPTAEYSVVGTPAVYSFDAVGNRLDLGGSYTPGNRITQFNGCSYTTDLDGNVTSRSGGGCGAGASFFWSAEGELDSLHTGTTGVKYLYDAGGRLVVKRVNGVVQPVFLWQGDNLLAELDGTATVKRAEYSYYPGLDNLHAVVINNERLYAHADGLGNVIALTDETQGVRRVYAYDDWGNDAGTGGTSRRPGRFFERGVGNRQSRSRVFVLRPAAIRLPDTERSGDVVGRRCSWSRPKRTI